MAIQRVLKSEDWLELVTRDDGNCMFDSAVLALWNDMFGKEPSPPKVVKFSNLLRKRVVWFECTHSPNKFLPFFNNNNNNNTTRIFKRHCESMARNRTWGGNHELVAISNLFGKPIIVVTKYKGHYLVRAQIFPDDYRGNKNLSLNPATKGVLTLLYCNENHYEALVKISTFRGLEEGYSTPAEDTRAVDLIDRVFNRVPNRVPNARLNWRAYLGLKKNEHPNHNELGRRFILKAIHQWEHGHRRNAKHHNYERQAYKDLGLKLPKWLTS